MKTVVHLCTVLRRGGAENHLLTLLAGLGSTGEYKPHLVAFRADEGGAASLRGDFERSGVQVHLLGQERAWDPRGVVRLAALLRQIKPAIVHTHLCRSDLFGPPTAALSGVPMRVSTVHNVEERFRKRAFQPLFRASYHFDQRIIAISDAIAAALVRYLGLRREKIARIYYGCAPLPTPPPAQVAQARAALGFAADELVIGTLGRLAVQKGQTHLVAAFARLHARQPNARLLLVGHPDPDGTAERLRAQVAALGIERQVVFAGFRADVAAVLSAMDIFVLPSLWEGFGLVLLEAMGLGRPIVASAVDAIPEVVRDGVEGLLVCVGSDAALAAALERLLTDAPLRQKLGAAGAARAREFPAARMLAETVALYRSLEAA